MMRPKMKSGGYSTVRLPEFTGGVNLKDAATSVKDNQLVAADNMIHEEGEFKTRKGFAAEGNVIDTSYVNEADAKNKVPWDWIYSRTHNLVVNHTLSERYKLNGENWELENTGEIHLKNIYVAHNTFRNTWQKDEGYSNQVYGNVNTWLITDDGAPIQAYISHSDSKEENPGQTQFTYYRTRYISYSGKSVIENGLGLFLYICGRFSGGRTQQSFRLYELKHTKDSNYVNTVSDIPYVWEEITEENLYAPTVLVNGKGNTYSYLPANEFTEYSPQSMWEGFNLLTPKFKAYFTTDGGNYTDNSGVAVWKGSRSFTIPWTVARKKTSDGSWVLANDFKITYTDNDGKENIITILAGDCYSKVKTDFGSTGYADLPEDSHIAARAEIRLYSQKATVYFWCGPTYSTGGGVSTRFDLPRGIANNLLFEGYAEDRGGSQIIGDMGSCEWFGGNGEGISGGTRLFLYGGEFESNRLMWSDVDNPLYFPENNHTYIGDQSDKITKLAKQSNMLVIFKRYSIHYTTYVDNNSSYTSEDVLNGLVSDVAAISAIFPITQISGEVGCDLPSTMQICDNNLVWCNSDGRIYTLKTANQYSENNIYELSYPISPLIREKLNKLAETKASNTLAYSLSFNKEFVSRNCYAIDFDGRYWLLVGDTMFILRYSDSGFKYAYSYREGNSVKRSIGYDVLELSEGIFKTLDTIHTRFKELATSERYTNEELQNLEASDYSFRSAKAKVYHKSAGFIKCKDCLCFLLESKITAASNRSDVICRSARVFKLKENATSDMKLQDIIDSGNKTAKVDGFGITYSDAYDKPIGSGFTTKLYDFGGASVRKRIEHIYFDVFPKTDSTITVVAHTEKGRELLEMFQAFEIEGAQSKHIRCNLHGVRRLQLEISVSGAVAISGFDIKYKNLGR